MKTKTAPKKKEHSRSLFYRVSAWLHLWLGLATGIVMVIVCLTGCIWVFQDEITSIFLEPEANVARQDGAVLLPSEILGIAQKAHPGERVSYAMYHQGRAIDVNVGERGKDGAMMKINPYSGQVISDKVKKEGESGFFRWILNGHRFLWMPYKIGRPIVNYSTLIFVITLISGLVLWWPKKWNKSTRQQSFLIKWNGKFKRVNYDLHNVLGFYALLVLMAIGLTGMVYGIEWFSKGLYWSTSGGKALPEFSQNQSDTLQTLRPYTPGQAFDQAWAQVASNHLDSKGFYITFPDSAKRKATINVTVYPSVGQFYDSQSYSFDQFTLNTMPKNEVYDTKFSEAAVGAQIRRMNYDIHIGSILGLPGKFLAFFASLIGATLPITGFIIWWGKRKKGKGRKTSGKAVLENEAVARASRKAPVRRPKAPVFTPTMQAISVSRRD